MKQTMLRLVACALVLHSLLSLSICAQKRTEGLDDYNETPSRLRSVIDRFEQDYGALNRWYSAPYSTNRAQRMTRLYSDELALVTSFNFDSLNHDEQVDYLLFKNYLDHEQKELARSQQQISEMSALIPFAHNISDLEDSRRRMETMDPAKAASTLNELA